MPSMFQRVCLPQDLEAIRFRLLSDSETFSAPNGEQHFNSTGQTRFPGPKSPRGLPQAGGAWSVKPPLNLTLLMATVAWCLAIVAAPYFHSGPIYFFFSTICHQLPARSWHIQGEPLGLCIRCTSISLGFLAGQLAIRTPNVRWLEVCDRNYSNGMASRSHGSRFRTTKDLVRGRSGRKRGADRSYWSRRDGRQDSEDST